MSAASSVCCAVSSSVLFTAAFSRAASFDSLYEAIARTWRGDAPERGFVIRQPHQAIHEDALFRTPDRRLVRRRGRRIEGRRRQPIDDVFQPGQRRVDRVLRHHPRRAIELQYEPDRHVRGDRCRA